MSTDYNYDEQVRPFSPCLRSQLTLPKGQFFPFFILTITGLVTLPLTYSLLRPSKGVPRGETCFGLLRSTDILLELENTAPRIKSDFKPEDEDLIQGQKRKQWRKERRIKRIITVALGYAVMAWMVYLIAVTARTIPKIWDPYNILGISRVY